ncbi:MAG: prolyl oligopeptidase family serine peptidase [Anaerolineae bacterium]|nr:prolyl oligopeptidase family serine peptidase [Anaerolineae bacterium]
MQEKSFSAQISLNVGLRYLLYLPQNYESQAAWPLILFLHGRGERGSDLDPLKLHGLPRLIHEGQHFPFIIVSPQCPLESYWTEQVEALNALLDAVIATERVDTRRVYLTGLSMGGHGTWLLAGRYPQRFAAIAPICGSGQKWLAEERLTQTPVWAFHGDADPVVPIERSREMVDALRAGGGHVRFTVYPGVDHNSWDATYSNPELYIWFLSHTQP